MQVILDTHIFIWALTNPAKLSKSDFAVIQDARNKLYVSAASLWELSFLMDRRPGELKITSNLEDFISKGLYALNAHVLPILPAHAQRHYEIQPVEGHSDLFDRMILAQAASTGFSLLSYDRQFPYYRMVKLAGKRK
jgi:PIN domain nuclease of toxin-antitoxin system